MALWGCWFPRLALAVLSMLVLMGEGTKVLLVSEAHKRMDTDSCREPALFAWPLCSSVSLPLPYNH